MNENPRAFVYTSLRPCVLTFTPGQFQGSFSEQGHKSTNSVSKTLTPYQKALLRISFNPSSWPKRSSQFGPTGSLTSL